MISVSWQQGTQKVNFQGYKVKVTAGSETFLPPFKSQKVMRLRWRDGHLSVTVKSNLPLFYEIDSIELMCERSEVNTGSHVCEHSLDWKYLTILMKQEVRSDHKWSVMTLHDHWAMKSLLLPFPSHSVCLHTLVFRRRQVHRNFNQTSVACRLAASTLVKVCEKVGPHFDKPLCCIVAWIWHKL